MVGEDTVYNDIEKLNGSGGGFYIPGLNNPVAAYGNLRYVGVFLLGEYLAHYFCVSNFSSSICSYILISNYFEYFSSCYPFFLLMPLSPVPIPWQRRPSSLQSDSSQIF